MIIAFEGGDATFKETNAKKLYENIKHTESEIYGHAELAHFESFPRYKCSAAYLVEKFLNGEYTTKSPKLIGQAFAFDHFDYWSNMMDVVNAQCVSIEREPTIVLDRSHISNVAFQLGNMFIGRYKMLTNKLKPYPVPSPEVMIGDNLSYWMGDAVTFAQDLWNQMSVEMRIPTPDLVIHMDRNVKSKNEALEGKEGKDIFEKDFDLQVIINDVYRYVYKMLGVNVTFVPVYNEDGTYRTEDEIAIDVLTAYLAFVQKYDGGK